MAEVMAMPEIPHTILLLRSLKPGQKIVYYRGNQATDLRSCAPNVYNGVGDDGAPNCRAMLMRIFEEAWTLSRQGRIQLSKCRRAVMTSKGSVRIIEYSAVGL